MVEIKNTMDGRINTVEEWINQLEDKVEEIF